MKQTKYLFDGSRSPEGMISVSQLQTFLSCRKKWEYNYIEDLKPRIERAYLSIGKLCHTGMQTAMYYKWAHEKEQGFTREDALRQAMCAIETEYIEYIDSIPLLTEEIPDMEQILKDAEAVFEQAFWEFDIDRYSVLTLKRNREEIPALELHFAVPCPPTKGMHGYIDAILKDRVTNSIWCVDYKFRKSLAPDDEEAFNVQNAVYAYACQKMGIEITGTLTWQHLNTPAAEPQVLKDGKLSRSKIKTTWEKYRDFCWKMGQDPKDYAEMEEKLADIEWFRATMEYRNPETIGNIWNQCIVPVAKQIKAARGKKACNFRSLYPWNCKMCQYQSICQAELRNYDVEAIKAREYVQRARLTPIEGSETES